MGRACRGEPRSRELAALRAQLHMEREAHRLAEQALEALPTGAAAGVLGIHLVRDGRGNAIDAVIRHADGPALRLLGMRRHEAIGRRLATLVAGPGRGLARRILSLCLQGSDATRPRSAHPPSHRRYLLVQPAPGRDGFTITVVAIPTGSEATTMPRRPASRAGREARGAPLDPVVHSATCAPTTAACDPRHPGAAVYLFPEPALAVDANGTVLAWNAAATATFGWAETDLVGTAGPTATVGEASSFATLVERVRTGDIVSGLDGTLASRSRGDVPVSFSAAPFAGDGDTVGAIVVVLDATPRRRLEQELRRAKDEISLLAQGLHETFVFRWRRSESRPDYISASVERVTGFTAQELTEAPTLLAGGVHSDDWDLLGASLRSGMAMRRPVTFRWRRRDGPVIWIEQRLELLAGEGGRGSTLVGVAADVTARVAAEDALRRVKRAYAEWLTYLPVIIYRVYWHGRQAHVWTSDNAAALTGFAPDDVHGQAGRVLSLIHPDDEARFRRHLDAVWQVGSAEVECRWQHADGTYHLYRHRAVAVRRGETAKEMRGIAVLAAPDEAGPPTGASTAKGRQAVGEVARRRVLVAIPPGMAGAPRRPERCPYCAGSVLSRHQSQRRLVDDGRLEVETVRYRCESCGRTFTEHPAGVSRSSQTEAVRRISILLYGLGLSLRQVSHVLDRAGVHLSPSSIRRNALPIGAAMRHSLPAGTRCVLAEDETPTTGAFVVLERVTLGGDGSLPAGVELLVWSSDTDLLAWLHNQAAMLGMDVRD